MGRFRDIFVLYLFAFEKSKKLKCFTEFNNKLNDINKNVNKYLFVELKLFSDTN